MRALQFELTIEARRFLTKTGSKERHHNEMMRVHHRRGVRSDPSDPLSQLKNFPRWFFLRRSDPQRSQRSTQSTEKLPAVGFSVFFTVTQRMTAIHTFLLAIHMFSSAIRMFSAIQQFSSAIQHFQMFRQCRNQPCKGWGRPQD